MTRSYIAALVATLFAIVSLIVAAPRVLADNTRGPDLETLMMANVMVGDKARPFCSGSVIDKARKLVLTAHHCIYDSVKTRIDHRTGKKTEVWSIMAVYYGGKVYVAKIVAYDRRNDEALLQVIDPKFKPPVAMKVAPTDYRPRLGQPIWILGNPKMNPDIVTRGIVSCHSRGFDWGHGDQVAFCVDAAVMPGSSGGMVIDENGRIIGSVTGNPTGENVATNYIGSSIAVPEMLRKAGLLPRSDKIASR